MCVYVDCAYVRAHCARVISREGHLMDVNVLANCLRENVVCCQMAWRLPTTGDCCVCARVRTRRAMLRFWKPIVRRAEC